MVQVKFVGPQLKNQTKKIRYEHTNLSTENILGLKELSERKDLRIILTDKSKKMQIVTQETYDKMTNEYTKDAKEVNMEELKNREANNNGHTSSISRSFMIGAYNIILTGKADHTNTNIAAALHSANQHGAGLDVFAKDHKKLNEDGTYKSRPLSNCIGSISEPLGGLLVLILDKIKAQEPEHSKKSTEEMLEHIMRINNDILSKCKDMNDFAERYIASVDVKALYVEIKPDRAAEEIYESIVEGDWLFDVDNSEMTKYISVNWSREKIMKHGLEEYIPFRTKTVNGITMPNYNLSLIHI